MTGAISLHEAEDYLGAGRVQATLLLKHGFIRPFSIPGCGLKDHLFAKAELDGFLAALLTNAQPTGPGHALFSIPEAAKRANCSAAEIVRLILDKRLSRLAVDPDRSGYGSVLVDADEVRDFVRGPSLDGLAASHVQRELRTTHRVVKGLIAHGILPTVRRTNPLNRCPVDVVPAAAFRHFAETYISLTEIARSAAVHHMRALRSLETAGVAPAFDKDRLHAAYYSRSEVETLSL